VAATGFIPRVLSFLCALSHLERDAHRPNHLFIQPQTPLSPGESVSQLVTSHTQSRTAQLQLPTEIQTPASSKRVQKWKNGLTVTASGQRLHAQVPFRIEDAHGFPDTTQDFRFRTEVNPALSESITGFWFNTEVYTGFLRARHRLFGSQRRTKVLCRTRVRRTAQSPYTLRPSDRMRAGGPSHSSPWPFYSHAPGLTLVALGTACVPPARIPSSWLGT
jgi:hypothetical protein